MVIGLLTIAAIPSTIAICQGISAQKNAQQSSREDRLLRKFHLHAWCEGSAKTAKALHEGRIVLADNKAFVVLSTSPHNSDKSLGHNFEGFYITYPDEDRPPPRPLGLVTSVSDDPPMLNWLYIDKETGEVKYGNKTQSKEHLVGSWGSTIESEDGEFEMDNTAEKQEDDDEAGGLLFRKDENFVVVEPAKGEREGRWHIWWDKDDDLLAEKEQLKGRKVLRVSLERTWAEPPKPPVEKVKTTRFR